jgi:hypothetical protein
MQSNVCNKTAHHSTFQQSQLKVQVLVWYYISLLTQY